MPALPGGESSLPPHPSFQTQTAMGLAQLFQELIVFVRCRIDGLFDFDQCGIRFLLPPLALASAHG
jgi:hypothetical protein